MRLAPPVHSPSEEVEVGAAVGLLHVRRVQVPPAALVDARRPPRGAPRIERARIDAEIDPASGDIELASLRQGNQREQDLLQARATRALTGALSNEVGRVVQDTFGVDSFQITPLLLDPEQQTSRLNVNPAARVTIGKRISSRAYLTFSQSLTPQSTSRDQIILLEYDQSDRLSWLLSQNEDRTYALEMRVRHAF